MKTHYTHKGVTFDDYVSGNHGLTDYAPICAACAQLHKLTDDVEESDYDDSICGVEGCNNHAEHSITFYYTVDEVIAECTEYAVRFYIYLPNKLTAIVDVVNPVVATGDPLFKWKENEDCAFIVPAKYVDDTALILPRNRVTITKDQQDMYSIDFRLEYEDGTRVEINAVENVS